MMDTDFMRNATFSMQDRGAVDALMSLPPTLTKVSLVCGYKNRISNITKNATR